MSIRRIWKTKEISVTEEQIQACGNDKILALLLKNRGIETIVEINKFLNPLKASLSSPDVFVDLEKATKRISSAIENNEHITIYGDFDADGITSTSVLYLTLKEIGANVDYYIPERSTESHGLNTKALVKIIAKKKSRLIITVDCGISNVNEITFAKGFKTDVIITDHHEAPEILPDAFAIINPKAPNALEQNLSIEELKSLNYLAGVGVAFKLACKLLEKYNKEIFVNEILPLVAIGTIGDVVELLGENRSLVAMGLELIKAGKHKGIQKLLSEIGIEDKSKLTAENIAFGIVPRLNAAGRLENPLTALKLLISNDEKEISESVKTLNDLNALRQELCDETFKQASLMYEKEKFKNKKSIVLFNENWHIGIIGIVASKLVEKYNKPTFLMTRDAHNTNIIRCSSRSIEQMNIYEVLSQHKDELEGFGGHKMAAGFSFDETKISFETFKRKLNKTIDEVTQDVDFSKSIIKVDLIVEPEDITFETIENINKLQPCGSGNPNPLFIINDLTLKQYRQMGSNNAHLKLFVSKNNTENIECVKWNFPNFNVPENSKIDLLCYPQINCFNGNTSIQYMIEDIHSEHIKQEQNTYEINILDHRQKKDILNQVLDFINTTKKTTGIFIQNKTTQNSILHYEKAIKCSFNMDSIPIVEQLMFFDVPNSQDEFIQIIKESNAQTVHLLNFNVVKTNVDTFVAKLSGMLKYAISNLNGKFEIEKLSKALWVSDELILAALNLFDDTEMIDLNQISEAEYKISYLHPVELSKIKQSGIYSDLEEKLAEINSFKEFYLTAKIDEIKEFLMR